MNKKIMFVIAIIVILIPVGQYACQKYRSPAQHANKLYPDSTIRPADQNGNNGILSTDGSGQTADLSHSSLNVYYTCPMHPSVHKDKPGACPICGMTLVKKTTESALSESERYDMRRVSISPAKQVLANVKTTKVHRMVLERDIRAVGEIAYAESNIRTISMRYSGRLDKLYLTYTGQRVHEGDPVANVYSPEAISAQQEYLVALDSYSQVKDAADVIAGDALALVDQSREKLRRWGFTESQIAELNRTKQVLSTVTFYSPVTGVVVTKNVQPQKYVQVGDDLYEVADVTRVWLSADIYENDLQLVKIGQPVTATCDAYPDKVFKGRITFINPFVDPSSRSMKVRIEFENINEALKAEMYLSAVIHVQLSPSLAVPASALLSTGDRQVVWVQRNPGVFEPRQVVTGFRTHDFVQIIRGVDEGETVVSSGGYLIDSESQLETATDTTTGEKPGMDME
jgi:Cu(I)/Ag(I) efflux system membrane fusion protein